MSQNTPHSVPQDRAQTPSRDEHAPRRQDPLLRLRERVERAVAEIERLRRENAALAERIQSVAQDPLFKTGDAVEPPSLALDEDPEALREKINDFIEALDRVLAERSSDLPTEPSDASG